MTEVQLSLIWNTENDSNGDDDAGDGGMICRDEIIVVINVGDLVTT